MGNERLNRGGVLYWLRRSPGPSTLSLRRLQRWAIRAANYRLSEKADSPNTAGIIKGERGIQRGGNFPSEMILRELTSSPSLSRPLSMVFRERALEAKQRMPEIGPTIAYSLPN